MNTNEQAVQVVGAELGEMLDISRVAAESYEDIASHVPTMTNDELLETIDYLSTGSASSSLIGGSMSWRSRLGWMGKPSMPRSRRARSCATWRRARAWANANSGATGRS